MSSAEGPSVEAPQAPRVGFGRGCPLPNRARVWGGAVMCPLPRIYFFNFLPRNGAFFQHSDTIRQFTRPVAIRLKPEKAQTSVPTPSACCIPLKRLPLAVLCHS